MELDSGVIGASMWVASWCAGQIRYEKCDGVYNDGTEDSPKFRRDKSWVDVAMKKNSIIMIICILLSGCAKYHDGLVHPETKASVNCVSEGWGWLGTPMAARNSNLCIERYSAAGYIPVDEYIQRGGDVGVLATATVSFTSNVHGATIYAGPATANPSSWVRLIGKTPWTLMLNHPRVIPECYKATYDGKESDTICFSTEDHSRRVNFTFK